MPGPLSIRPARRADAETLHAAIRDMAAGLGVPHQVTSTPESLRRHGFGEAPAFEGLVAEEGEAFAGMCLFFPSFSSWRGAPGAYVLDLYVAAAFRGRGVGEKLLAEVARRTSARGGVYVRLSVDAENLGAQGFYKRLGFRWKGEERVFALHDDAFWALAAKRDAAK
ncbi:MAG TPA: N-acetyltransferase [Mesorhizobium sp.]|jgi:ribosomal protein S18 acetylase RimI-like enzyme|nr:N-acetyltransferase [Mesorhizobium sp.]